MTLSAQCARHARAIGDRVAITFEGTELGYRTMDQRVSKLANALRERGVRPGDRVAVLGMNSVEVLETYVACTRLGAICVPLNFRLVADEIRHVLTDCDAAAAVVHAPLAPTMAAARGELAACLVFGGHDPGPGAEDYEQALDAADEVFTGDPVDERGPAFIMYTSGTTSRPKGAVLSHHGLAMHVLSHTATIGARPEDELVWLAAAPLFHVAGLTGMLPTFMRGGRTVLLPSGRFDAEATVALMERERVTACFLVPAQWQAICDVPEIARRDLSALRRAAWGAASASSTLVRRIVDTFPQAEVTTALAQTECGPVTTLLRGADALRKLGSVGTPLLNVEVRVVDEHGHDVPRGEVGEIVYRSPMLMLEYWNRPAETAEAFRGGWFHSGDLGREDEEGYLYVVDRRTDMIISGGENVYSAEVEDVLATHPKVAHVALIGVPHEKWGETPLAVVTARSADDPPTPADISRWCTGRLARYKHPTRLAVLAELPRNPGGKVLKTRLRADHAAGTLAGEPVPRS